MTPPKIEGGTPNKWSLNDHFAIGYVCVRVILDFKFCHTVHGLTLAKIIFFGRLPVQFYDALCVLIHVT